MGAAPPWAQHWLSAHPAAQPEASTASSRKVGVFARGWGGLLEGRKPRRAGRHLGFPPPEFGGQRTLKLLRCTCFAGDGGATPKEKGGPPVGEGGPPPPRPLASRAARRFC